MPTDKERRPGGNGTASETSTTTKVADTASVPTELWEALIEGRFRLAVKCTCCGHWLTARKSVALNVGPVCRARAEVTA